MKRTLVALALTTPTLSAFAAGPWVGFNVETLLSRCRPYAAQSTVQTYEQTFCAGYLMGAVDGMGSMGDLKATGVCPKYFVTRQIAATFVKYADQHPEKRSTLPPLTMLWESLHDAFPCRKE